MITESILSAREVIEKIGKIEYKPNYTVVLEPSTHDSPMRGSLELRISAILPDSDNAKNEVCLSRVNTTPSYRGFTVDEVSHFIQAELTRFEIHEMYEWLRIKGERVKEPHDK